jgi:hypothetical protein
MRGISLLPFPSAGMQKMFISSNSLGLEMEYGIRAWSTVKK